MVSFRYIGLLSLFLILAKNSVDGISCFQCNSVNNSECFKLENYLNDRNYDVLKPTACPVYKGYSAPFCRKMVLKILDKTTTTKMERVIRTCGYTPHKRECYNTDNEGHQQKVCQCFEDGCNGTQDRRASYFITFATVLFTIVCLFRTA